MLWFMLLAMGVADEPDVVAELSDSTPLRRLDPLHEAAMLLSHYPAGLVPTEPATLQAIGALAALGDRSEISLLRNLADNESDQISDAAMLAIATIRDRQVDEQRLAFARTLPNSPELSNVAQPLRKLGMGREEARCAGYARLILAESETVTVTQVDGDPWTLLAHGKPRKALGAVRSFEGDEARLLEARAHEEIGDVHGAMRIYAVVAATGNPDARAAIDGFGVDAERLLLGMLVQGEANEEDGVLDVLVRHGSHLTVAVLAERARKDDLASLTAVSALARMLQGKVREQPLRSPSQRVARKALVLASREGSEAVREHVLEVLQEIEAEKL